MRVLETDQPLEARFIQFLPHTAGWRGGRGREYIVFSIPSTLAIRRGRPAVCSRHVGSQW